MDKNNVFLASRNGFFSGTIVDEDKGIWWNLVRRGCGIYTS